MIISVPRPARWPVTAAMFADITSKEVSRLGWAEVDGDSVFEVQFTVNLTVAESDRVRRRLTTSGDVEETLQTRAVSAYQDLLAFENLATPTNAQVVTVVRLLCKVARGLIRLQLRQFDAAD